MEQQEKVFSEQIEILHHNLLASIPANFICASIVFISLHQNPHNHLISAWFAAVVIVSILRLLAFGLYHYCPKYNHLHLVIFISGVVLSAALWGTLDSILMPLHNNLEQMIIIVIIAGVTSGGVQTLNANLISCLAYLTIILSPLCIWFFTQDTFSHFLLGITMTAYMLFMLGASIRSYKLLTTALNLQHENDSLIDKLSVSNNQLLETSQTLYEESTHDSLTGLFNRRYLDETLSRELQRITREKQSLCIAMLDIDFFKHFNDTHGHDAGDELLRFIGELLQETFRGSDISCRYGGEEFIVVLENTTIATAEMKLEHFRKLVKNGKVYFRGQLLPSITVSIGIAEAPRQGTSSKTIIHAADKALYLAKNTGRDRVKCSTMIATEIADEMI